MEQKTLTRAAGILVMLSGITLGYSYISHPHQMAAEVIASTSWVVIHILFAFSLILGLLGTTALYGFTAFRSGSLGLIGFLLLFPGMMMIFGLNYYEVFIAPYLATHYPQVIEETGAGDTMGWIALAFPMAGLLTVTGYALLGWAWKRAVVLPRLAAIGLIVSSLAFGVGLSPLGGIIAAQITAALFGLALISTGTVAALRPECFYQSRAAQ